MSFLDFRGNRVYKARNRRQGSDTLHGYGSTKEDF